MFLLLSKNQGSFFICFIQFLFVSSDSVDVSVFLYCLFTLLKNQPKPQSSIHPPPQ